MHVGDSEFLEVVDAGGEPFGREGAVFGECEELTLVGNARRGVLRHVAVVHLVDYDVREVVDLGSAVGVPACWIGLGEVDDGGSCAVYAHCLGPYARSLVEPATALLYLEGVEFAVELLSGDGSRPGAGLGGGGHVQHLIGLAGAAVFVEVHAGGGSFGAPEAEVCAGAVDGELEVVAAICGV